MKNLKISLTALIFAILLTISTGVFASDRSAIFDDEVIKMPSTLNNGKGTVSTTSLSGATLSYQFVIDGITSTEIHKIERYEEEIAIARAYNTYTNNMINPEDTSDENYIKYVQLLNAYKEKYFSGITDESAMILQDGVTRINSSSAFTEEKIDVWESYIETLYGDRGDNWTDSTDGSVQIDLSTFTGKRYVVLWARYTKNGANQYRPQWYEVTGTKVDEPKNENKPVDNTQKPTNNYSTKKDTTTTEKTIPHTGVSSAVFVLLAIAGNATVISYRKYSKIK